MRKLHYFENYIFFNSNLEKILQGSLKLNFSVFLIIPHLIILRAKWGLQGEEEWQEKQKDKHLRKF